MRTHRVLLAASAIGLTAGMPAAMYYSLGSFITPLEREFGWTRADISLAITGLTLTIFFLATPMGRLCDRFSPALIASTSLVVFAITLAFMAHTVATLDMFWLFYVVLAIVGIGTTPPVLVRPVADAFKEHRGLALGIALTGGGIAAFWIPQVVTHVSETSGWRNAYLTLATISFLAAPLVWFGFRHGDVGFKRRATQPEPPDRSDLMAIVRNPHFWILTGITAAMATGMGGIIVHLMPLLRDEGINPGTAAGIASIIGITTVIGRVVVGVILDRYHPPLVSMAVFALAALGMLLLLLDSSLAILAVPLIGVAAGAEIDMLAFLSARYFGTRRFGLIYGWQYAVFAIGYGVSPFIVGLLFDNFGNYDMPLMMCAALAGLAAALGYTLGLFPTRPLANPPAPAE